MEVVCAIMSITSWPMTCKVIALAAMVLHALFLLSAKQHRVE